MAARGALALSLALSLGVAVPTTALAASVDTQTETFQIAVAGDGSSGSLPSIGDRALPVVALAAATFALGAGLTARARSRE